MVEERTPIDVKTAVEKVMLNAGNILTQREKIPFQESNGRILAENLLAMHAVPPFSKSPYDGFALRAVDTKNASSKEKVSFTVTEHVGAGSRAANTVTKGQAVRIMTGAEIPDGADCVVMFEKCETFTEKNQEKMILATKMESGENIIEEGSETKAGQVLVAAGTKINPGIIALLATFGYSEIEVYKKPVVGIYATGSELLDVNQPLEPGKIRNSNAYMIAAQVDRAGGEARYLGKLADEVNVSFSAIKESIEEVDVLITTGGVSVGDYDLLPEIYEKLDAEVLFNKVAMRPGSVTTVAKKGTKYLFGLSGNPSACYVGFELFTRPYLNLLLGKKAPYPEITNADLDADFPKPNPFTRFVRGRKFFRDGRVKVKPAGIDKSGIVTSLAETNALMVLPGGTEGYHQNDIVSVILVEEEPESENFPITPGN